MKHEIEIYESEPSKTVSMPSAFSGSIQSFEDAQRIAGALAKSTLVPKDYQGNVANTMIALEMAQRVNASPMAVMQNLYIIHGRPSWSSQFTIAALNGCGRFSALRFAVDGSGDNKTCTAWAYDKSDGDKLYGPTVSITMAKAEGWYQKNGSKWKTMPDLMLRYRAAKFFGNLYAPDIMMGMTTEDESIDIRNRNQPLSEKPVIKQGFTQAKTETTPNQEQQQQQPEPPQEIEEF
ncbi:hypothetical protein NVP1256O_56 [Vibrio phage 1.256.O._10N.286.45.F8]|nr:hypothetical protein NVP1256O_56 [Vibrio phage 1.256.O._10N.286.45.F8]